LELADVIRRAAVGRARDEALFALADAYRTWATEHPGRYVATVRAPAPGDGDDEVASLEVYKVVIDVLHGYGITDDDAVDATRSLRATLHGFVTLQSAGAFGMPVDIDRSFHRMISGLARVLAHWHLSQNEDAQ
jgi:hypothetical protein